MIKMPRTPDGWDDPSPNTAQEPPRPDPGAGGILDGWHPPGWSPETNGLGFLLHPQAIAQTDFGDEQNRSAQARTLEEKGTTTAQPVTAPARGSPGLGSLSARYESHGDPGTVSSGYNDHGGASYGTYQFATNTGDATAFTASPEFRPWAREFDHLAPGTTAFGDQWRAVAARDPDAFRQAQDSYIRRTHYDPVVSQVNRNTGYDIDGANDAVREAAWSASVQHRAAATILTDALRTTDQAVPRTDPNYESQLIDNIYDRRTEYVRGIRDRLIANNHAGQARNLNSVINNRYPRERLDAQNMLRNQGRR